MRPKLYLLLFLFLLLTTCEKMELDTLQSNTNTVTALKNGDEWSAKGEVISLITPTRRVTMNLEVKDQDGILREVMSFDQFSPILGVQPITTSDHNSVDELYATYFITADDAIHEFYSLDTTRQDNFIEVQSYDPVLREIKGIFNVSMSLTESFSNQSGVPERVVFTQGEFTANVEPGWFD